MLDYKYYNIETCDRKTGCVKRALAVITDFSLDEINELVENNKADPQKSYNKEVNYQKVIELLGGRIIQTAFHTGGIKRWHVNTIENVIKNYSTLLYIIVVNNHMFAIKDNTIYDIIDDRKANRWIEKMYVFNATDLQVEELQKEIAKGE